MRTLLIKSDLLSGDLAAVPPLGLLHVANVAHRLSVETEILDLRIEKPHEIGSLLRKALDKKPDLIGLSCLPQDHRFVAKLTGFLRRNMKKDALIVGGGPYFASCTAEALESTKADFAVLGEGEKSFEHLIGYLRGDVAQQDIPGVGYRSGGEVLTTEIPKYLTPEELDAMYPLPWDLIDLRQYARFTSYSGRQGTLYAPILTSRGCPYKCTNCFHMLGYSFRGRSAENVRMEIEDLKSRYPIRRIEVLDETFNINRNRALEILKELETFPDLDFDFPRGLRGDLVDEETIAALKRVNCRLVSLPIETASMRLQKVLRKNVNIPKTLNALKMAKEAGLYTWGFFMVGLPTETRQEADETFEMARSAGYDMPIVFILTPHPGTDLWDTKRGDPDPENLNFYYGNYNYFSDVPADYLYQRRMKALGRAFIFNPKNWFMVAGYYKAFLQGILNMGLWKFLRYVFKLGRPRQAFDRAVTLEAMQSLKMDV